MSEESNPSLNRVNSNSREPKLKRKSPLERFLLFSAAMKEKKPAIIKALSFPQLDVDDESFSTPPKNKALAQNFPSVSEKFQQLKKSNSKGQLDTKVTEFENCIKENSLNVSDIYNLYGTKENHQSIMWDDLNSYQHDTILQNSQIKVSTDMRDSNISELIPRMFPITPVKVSQVFDKSLPVSSVRDSETFNPISSSVDHRSQSNSESDNLHSQSSGSSLYQSSLHQSTSNATQIATSPTSIKSSISHNIVPNVQTNEQSVRLGGEVYIKKHLIGRGGFSKVYRVVHHSTRKLYALKVIKCDSFVSQGEISSPIAHHNSEYRGSACFPNSILQQHQNEICLLSQLRGCSNIIHLFQWVQHVSKLLLLMEYGEISVDVYIRKRQNHQITDDANPILKPAFIKIGENQIVGLPLSETFYLWRSMVISVEQIHSHGIIHTDLKPANFVLCSGVVKLIDFGIAHALNDNQTSVERDCQIGTLNYISPEALMYSCAGLVNQQQSMSELKLKIGPGADIWSLGCILYFMLFGYLPFQHIPAHMKARAICDSNVLIQYPDISTIETSNGAGSSDHSENVYASAIEIMQKCLNRDRKNRPTAEELSELPFLVQTSQACTYREIEMMINLLKTKK